MTLRIWVTVKPGAKREEIRKGEDGQYTASVHAPAREGQANEALIELVSEFFSVPKSSVRIVRGHTARKKLLEIL